MLGFDGEAEEPIPDVRITELDESSEIVRIRHGAADAITISETPEGDLRYSGRIKDEATQEEFEIAVTINEFFTGAGGSTVTVSGTEATLSGGLGTITYVQIRDMIAANPEVNKLIIAKSSGSSNDDINVHTGRLIRSAGLDTHVPADGDINSGAVDLFTAGVNRTVEDGAILGVHSWCCKNGVTADKLPMSDEAHGVQLTYFREMLGDLGEGFYFYTLVAAPFETVHPMTRDEMIKYGLIAD